MTITRTCTLCQQTYTMAVDGNSYAKWEAGAMAQDVFSYLTADEREQIITGTHGECFDKAFADLSEDLPDEEAAF